MTTSNAPGSAIARPAGAARPVTRRLLTVGGATLAAAAVWIIARVAGTEPTVSMSGRPPMDIGLFAVVATALAASLAGWAALAVLERLTRRPRVWWTVLALATLASSFGPLLTARADAGTRGELALIHTVVGAVLILGLASTSSSRR